METNAPQSVLKEMPYTTQPVLCSNRFSARKTMFKNAISFISSFPEELREDFIIIESNDLSKFVISVTAPDGIYLRLSAKSASVLSFWDHPILIREGSLMYDRGNKRIGIIIGHSNEDSSIKKLRSVGEWDATKFRFLAPEKEETWSADVNDLLVISHRYVTKKGNYPVCEWKHEDDYTEWYEYYCPITNEDLHGYEIYCPSLRYKYYNIVNDLSLV